MSVGFLTATGKLDNRPAHHVQVDNCVVALFHRASCICRVKNLTSANECGGGGARPRLFFDLVFPI
jgi:hypothetical protein